MTNPEETGRQERGEESDTSGDSGLGDNSDLSDYLERAWLEETGYNNDESGDDTDDTFPPGWRISYQDLSPRIMSKSGEVFSSRREAFQWLCI